MTHIYKAQGEHVSGSPSIKEERQLEMVKSVLYLLTKLAADSQKHGLCE